MTVPAVSPIEATVSYLANSNGCDPVLDRLVQLANLDPNASLGFPIGLIVGGHVFCGSIGRDLDFAARFDGITADLVGHAEQSASNDAEAGWASLLRTLFVTDGSYGASVHRRFADERDMHGAMQAADDWDPEHGYDVAAAHIRRSLSLRTPRPAFTVIDAHRVVDGGLQEIGVLRVTTSEVASWWIWDGDIPSISPKAKGTSRITVAQTQPEVRAPTS